MPIRVLYCEDKEPDATSCKDFFEASEQYVVTVVEYGSDVLPTLNKSNYDVIVIDRQLLNDLNVGQIRTSEGILVALDIRRELEAQVGIPIIVFSAWDHTFDIDKVEEEIYEKKGIYFKSKRDGLSSLRDKIQTLVSL